MTKPVHSDNTHTTTTETAVGLSNGKYSVVENKHSTPPDDTQNEVIEYEKLMHDKPYQFGFYHALRCMENLYSDKPRIGESTRTSDDILRLSQEPSMAFSASTLAAFELAENDDIAKLSVNFFGLFGPNGPLPLHLTEYARDRMRNSDDPTFSAFIDIFHHRMLSLFYRSWANAQPTVNFDRPQQDRFSIYIGSLFGLALPSLKNRDEMPDFTKLHFSGRLSSNTQNVEGLISIIRSFFKINVEINEFIGEWMKLPDNCKFHLGESIESTVLGENITLGDCVWQCQQKFRIILGPLSIKQYEHFFPGKDSNKRLRAIVRNYVGDSINWDVKLLLKKNSVPMITLGENDFIGWNTWLGERMSTEDASDMVLEPLQDMT